MPDLKTHPLFTATETRKKRPVLTRRKMDGFTSNENGRWEIYAALVSSQCARAGRWIGPGDVGRDPRRAALSDQYVDGNNPQSVHDRGLELACCSGEMSLPHSPLRCIMVGCKSLPPVRYGGTIESFAVWARAGWAWSMRQKTRSWAVWWPSSCSPKPPARIRRRWSVSGAKPAPPLR